MKGHRDGPALEIRPFEARCELPHALQLCRAVGRGHGQRDCATRPGHTTTANRGGIALTENRLRRTAKTQTEKGFKPRSTRLVSILYARMDLPGTPPLSEGVQGVQDTPEEVQVAPKPGTPPQDLAA